MVADKKYVHEKELTPNHCAKTALQSKIQNSKKSDVNG